MKQHFYVTKWFSRLQSGFTVIEISIVMAIMLTLVGIATVNLLNAKQRSSINSSVTTLLSDIKNQQLKAMVGDTEGRPGQDRYGIHFESTGYTLFHGDIYNSSDTSNFTVGLGDSINVSTSLPQATLLLEKGSGEIVNYAAGSNVITLFDTSTNRQRVITLNELGVVTQVQ